jgi:hypothetical protein
MNRGELFVNYKDFKFIKKQIKDLSPLEIYLMGRRDMLYDIIENRVKNMKGRAKNA